MSNRSITFTHGMTAAAVVFALASAGTALAHDPQHPKSDELTVSLPVPGQNGVFSEVTKTLFSTPEGKQVSNSGRETNVLSINFDPNSKVDPKISVVALIEPGTTNKVSDFVLFYAGQLTKGAAPTYSWFLVSDDDEKQDDHSVDSLAKDLKKLWDDNKSSLPLSSDTIKVVNTFLSNPSANIQKVVETAGVQDITALLGSPFTVKVNSFPGNEVPLPAAFWLLGSALLGVGTFSRRKQQPAG